MPFLNSSAVCCKVVSLETPMVWDSGDELYLCLQYVSATGQRLSISPRFLM